jgi:hypothetical protein
VKRTRHPFQIDDRHVVRQIRVERPQHRFDTEVRALVGDADNLTRGVNSLVGSPGENRGYGPLIKPGER